MTTQLVMRASQTYRKNNNPTLQENFDHEVSTVTLMNDESIGFESRAHQFEEVDKVPGFTPISGSKLNIAQSIIQPKLKIGQPNDKYEQEADRMADLVVRNINTPSIQAKSKKKKNKPIIQRKCQTCQSAHTAPDNIAQKLKQRKGQGNPLAPQLQTKMEHGFGTDFSQVRVHTGRDAIQMNQQLGARAFTYGSDVYFNRGEYHPESTSGQRLLAHELTHVVQQGELHATNAIQRQQNEAEKVEQPHVSFIFGDLTSYNQLEAAARFLIAHMIEELEGIPENHRIHIRATEWIEGLRAWLPILNAQGNSNISSFAAGQAQLQIAEGEAIKAEISSYHQYVAQVEMRQVAKKAKAIALEAVKLRVRLNNSLRAAYHSGDTNIIEQVASTIGTVTDIGMSLHELARKCTEAILTLKGLEIPKVGRYVIALDKLNRGLAIINLAFSLTGDRATTHLEEGMRQVGIATGMFSSLATIAGLPAHMGLYANLYLVPLTNAIIAQISVITSHLQEDNDEWVKLIGEPLRYGIEPGGESMWRFMEKVMKANSIHETPKLSESVSEYFFDHKEKLEAGTGTEMPTTGWFFWRELHNANAKEWVYENRYIIWNMFYANRPVPR